MLLCNPLTYIFFLWYFTQLAWNLNKSDSNISLPLDDLNEADEFDDDEQDEDNDYLNLNVVAGEMPIQESINEEEDADISPTQYAINKKFPSSDSLRDDKTIHK